MSPVQPVMTSCPVGISRPRKGEQRCVGRLSGDGWRGWVFGVCPGVGVRLGWSGGGWEEPGGACSQLRHPWLSVKKLAVLPCRRCTSFLASEDSLMAPVRLGRVLGPHSDLLPPGPG